MQFLESKVKTSFFDDNLDNFRIWKKGVSLKKPSDVRIMEGILFKRSTGTNFWKSRYYVLFEDRLAYFKNSRESKEQAHCILHNMRIEKFSNNEKDEKHGIRLMHNLLSCDLFARNKEQYDKWLSALSSFCILTSYSTNFVNMKVIGKGSFARVYLVKRKFDNADLAVKTFDKNLLLRQDKAKASLINEINLMRKLNHDNIIRLHEVYESDNHIYLVLELLNGGELFERIVQKGQYTEKDSCILMKKLLSALAYMHSKGIMHRDIKPENLILKDSDNDWNVKIADFGLATNVNPSNDYLFKRCGTPGYVAPEVLADAKYDQKVDVFSAGVILYILLTGGSPFYGKSYNEILWKNKVCDIKFDFNNTNSRASELAIDLLKKMLAKDPAQRISAEQALQHEWIVRGGNIITESPYSPIYLSSAQENMRKFQEENRFNVKNIKPKDLDKSDLERCGHAPSPLINGKVLTITDSKNQSIFNSPEYRHTSILSNRSRFADPISSSKFTLSVSNVQNESSPTSTIDWSDDTDVVSEEHNVICENIEKYRTGFTLISQLKENSFSSTNSSKHSTPLISLRNQQETNRKAMNVQEHLLGYLENPKPKNTQQQKKTNIIRDALKLFY